MLKPDSPELDLAAQAELSAAIPGDAIEAAHQAVAPVEVDGDLATTESPRTAANKAVMDAVSKVADLLSPLKGSVYHEAEPLPGRDRGKITPVSIRTIQEAVRDLSHSFVSLMEVDFEREKRVGDGLGFAVEKVRGLQVNNAKLEDMVKEQAQALHLAHGTLEGIRTIYNRHEDGYKELIPLVKKIECVLANYREFVASKAAKPERALGPLSVLARDFASGQEVLFHDMGRAGMLKNPDPETMAIGVAAVPEGVVVDDDRLRSLMEKRDVEMRKCIQELPYGVRRELKILRLCKDVDERSWPVEEGRRWLYLAAMDVVDGYRDWIQGT